MIKEGYNDFLLEAYKQHQSGRKWGEICVDYTVKFREPITTEGLRKRVRRYVKSKGIYIEKDNFKAQPNDIQPCATYEQHNSDGSIESVKEILDDISQFGGDTNKILNYLGYNPTDWILKAWRVSSWDGGKDGSVKYSIQYKIFPKTEITSIDIVTAVKTALKSEIEPLSYKHTSNCSYNNKLMEIPPVELHLGKMSEMIETGEEYNCDVAIKRFRNIFDRALTLQNKLKCEKCLVVIGGDFFNSESDSCTSVHKIPQNNNMGYIKMFTEGVKMYKTVIQDLSMSFKQVDVMLCAGNHARAMETFLYIALEQAFDNIDNVYFRSEYKQTQCYEYGDNVIFYNHGDANLKQIIKSIPAEFGKEWGKHKYRELHMGHMHKEMTVDDDGGMITRRVGSPCATDAWHAQNRYVGAVKKHEIFVWDKDYGLEQLVYIPIN